MKRRSQAAMEFLMTYGWAILVVLVAIGALTYFGVLSPERFLPESCIIPTGVGLSCEDFSVDSDLNTITLRIRSIVGTVWVNNINIEYDETSSCTYSILDTEIKADKYKDFVLSCNELSSGNRIKGNIKIDYSVGNNPTDGLPRKTSGSLVLKIP